MNSSPAGAAPDVSVVVYVDANLENAAQMYAYVANLLREDGYAFEFIFVDDGNAPGIFFEMEGFQKFVRDTKVVRLSRTHGPSTAMAVGFQHARGRLILTLGPFLQIQPDDIRKTLSKIKEGYDFVNGWRTERSDSWVNRLHTRIYNGLIRWVSGVELHDTNCTLKLFRRDMIEQMPLYGDLYRFLPVLAARYGFKVCEVPVKQRRELNRVGVYAAGTYVDRFFDLLAFIFISKFTMTPLRFFGPFGGLLFLGGVVINVYLTVWKFMTGNPLADRPLLLLGVLLIVMGVQLASIGLVGELIIFALSNARQLRNYRVERVLQ